MSLLTVQRSPTPSDVSEKSENVSVLEPPGEVITVKSSNASASEDFIAVNGAAIALPSNARRHSVQDPPIGLKPHMNRIFNKLRSVDCLKLVVKLEALSDLPTDYDRYFCLVSYIGRQGTEESVILGFDLTPTTTSIGLVISVMLDMKVCLHGEGGFKVIVKRDHDYLFKPISVQALWATLQALTLALKVAESNNYYTNGLSHTWVNYYETSLTSTRLQMNEWRRTEDSDEESRGFMPAELPEEIDDRRRLENEIRTKLREVMLKEDLEVVTVSQLRQRLTEVMEIDLVPFRHFIGESVIFIFGQLESPSQIFDHVYLGSKWNACNLDELKQIGIGYIINITKEIDNFFPDVFHYYNVPLYDVESSDLMSFWEFTHKFINEARDNDSRVLVHCKMGMSRSASTVMAYAMKEYGWSFEAARKFVKDRRSCVHPNTGFLAQLVTYEGILAAKSNREKFNIPESTSTPSQEAWQGLAVRTAQTESVDLDHPINIEQEILLYKKPRPMGNSLSGSAETSGDGMEPSNPSIAPAPMEDASSESGGGGGLVIEDPRTRDMKSVRDDLFVLKDATEVPWRRSLRLKAGSGDGEEVKAADVIENAITSDDVTGGSASGASFRNDRFWIRDDSTVSEALPKPVLNLAGDLPGEEFPTDEPEPSESEASSDPDSDVVMRDHELSNSSLPPCGTVKRQSDRLESLREAPTSELDVYRREDIPLEPGIVKKTRQSIEARQRTSGEFSGAHSPTTLRVNSGEGGGNRHLSGGGLSPVTAAAAPIPTPAISPISASSFSSSPPPPPPPPPPADPGLIPAQVHQKMLQLIRQIGCARMHQRGAVDVQSVVREVENSVDREPILSVRHLVEVFRGAS